MLTKRAYATSSRSLCHFYPRGQTEATTELLRLNPSGVNQAVETQIGIDIEELKGSLGLASVNEARNRFNAIRDLLQPYMGRGDKNKILIGSEGVGLLRRLVDLEKSGLNLAQAEQELRRQLKVGSVEQRQPVDQTGGITTEKLIGYLEQQLAIKDRQLEEKDKQIARLQDIIQNRLPGEVSTQAVKEEDTMQYLRQLVQGQREEIERLRSLIEELRRPWWRRIFRPTSRRLQPQTVQLKGGVNDHAAH